MRVLLAFDKFGEVMTSQEACAIACGVIKRIKPDWEVEMCPLTDGSEGFARTLIQNRGGELVHVEVNGPDFKTVEANIGLIDCACFSLSSRSWLGVPSHGKIAVVEMAQACGLHLLTPAQRNLWFTSSYGLGEMIRAAVELNPELILVGVGGTATHDLGMGALEALGLRYRAENGEILTQITPHSWSRVVAVEGSVPQNMPQITVASNVQTRFFGPRSAAELFGGPKGLKKEEQPRMEEQSRRMAELLLAHLGASSDLLEVPGSGGAGGAGVGLAAAFGAPIWAGVEVADRWLRINEKVERAGLILTGQGKFDLTSLEGKAPEYVIERSSNRGKRIYCIAGELNKPDTMPLPEKLKEANFLPLGPVGASRESVMAHAIRYLTDRVENIISKF
jgi:glycerate kinase